MLGYERANLRKELDDAMLPFRLAQQRKGGATGRGKNGRGKAGRGAVGKGEQGRGEIGWLRNIRQAVGVPVDEVARRLGVCRFEVHRLEESEKNERIMLATLSRAAKGLGCELVYALIPMKGSLEDLATEQRLVQESALKDKRAARVLEEKLWLEAIGWREKFQNAMRTMLRRDGYRVRPRKTERGVAKQMAEYEETLKLVGMGKAMGKAASQQVSAPANRTRVK